MPRQKENPRPEIAPQPSQGLEPPNQSESNPNQLELHATRSPRQVRLQKEVFQAVTALARASAWAWRVKRQVVLVLDGLNKVSDRRHLHWFPAHLPEGVKLVLHVWGRDPGEASPEGGQRSPVMAGVRGQPAD